MSWLSSPPPYSTPEWTSADAAHEKPLVAVTWPVAAVEPAVNTLDEEDWLGLIEEPATEVAQFKVGQAALNPCESVHEAVKERCPPNAREMLEGERVQATAESS